MAVTQWGSLSGGSERTLNFFPFFSRFHAFFGFPVEGERNSLVIALLESKPGLCARISRQVISLAVHVYQSLTSIDLLWKHPHIFGGWTHYGPTLCPCLSAGTRNPYCS